jgi:hypothetical protein
MVQKLADSARETRIKDLEQEILSMVHDADTIKRE